VLQRVVNVDAALGAAQRREGAEVRRQVLRAVHEHVVLYGVRREQTFWVVESHDFPRVGVPTMGSAGGALWCFHLAMCEVSEARCPDLGT